MVAMSLLVLSICIGTILLTIHNRDEIHQLVAFLSGMIALVCSLVLMPPILKGLLGVVFFAVLNKFFVVHRSLK